MEMMKKIQHGLHFHNDVSKGTSIKSSLGNRLLMHFKTDARDLITKMMTVDPKKRITMEEIRKHSWILKDSYGPPLSFIPTFERVEVIEEDVMRDLVTVGFEDSPKSRGWILKNKHHAQITSAYHLFLHRRRQMNLTRAPTTPIQTRNRSQSTTQDAEFKPRRSTDQALDTKGIVVHTMDEINNSNQNM